MREAALFAQARQDVEDEGEDDAENDGGREGEVDGGVFAAPGEVAGQAAEGQAGFDQQQHDDADAGDQEPDEEEQAAEVVHEDSVQRLAVSW